MNRFISSNVLGIEKLDAVMIVLIALLVTVLMVFSGYKLLQMLQLTGYKLKGYTSWFKETKCSFVSRLCVLAFLSVASILMTNVLLYDFFVIKILSYVGILFFILFSTIFIANMFTAKQKTPLKYTKRMTRLVIIFSILIFCVSLVLLYVGVRFVPYLSYALVGIVPVFLPALVFISYFLTYPIEKLISNSYIKKAKTKLQNRQNIKVIGITGSYGKTTVKNILKTILSAKYKVCASPSSFNTPLGLSKTILSNLKDDDEIFIAEMGAKQRYDIAELCEMVKPQIGIITGIGNQHLLTFGTEENIIQTKGELAEFTQTNGGKLFVNVESAGAKTLAEKYTVAETISLSDENQKIYVKDIIVSKEGSSFKLCSGGREVKCKTTLLGMHNISNILLAAAVSLELGVSLEEMKEKIETLEAPKHRLEIIDNPGSFVIIDDSYNSSVQGSMASLEVISKFEGKKFVITPGLVELGSEQFNSNFEFGKNMAGVCDCVIIDSAINYDAISAGLAFGGFDEKNIIQVATLNDAVKMLGELATSEDVVLFENDLPDNYS